MEESKSKNNKKGFTGYFDDDWRSSNHMSEHAGDKDDDIEFEFPESEDKIKSYHELPRLTVKISKVNETKLQGYLNKKQPKAIIFGKWKQRFWVLKRDKFKYYENEESFNHLGVIDFNKVEASVNILPDAQDTFKIALNGSK